MANGLGVVTNYVSQGATHDIIISDLIHVPVVREEKSVAIFEVPEIHSYYGLKSSPNESTVVLSFSHATHKEVNMMRMDIDLLQLTPFAWTYF